MKIDWRHLATTPGYCSLKAAYIKDVKNSQETVRPMRDKATFLRKFRWVIGRAQHYAKRENVPIEMILNAWEEKRGPSWWLNYYQDSMQPKLHNNSWRPKRLVGRHKSRKKPHRWTMDYKRSQRTLAKYRNL